MKQDSVLDMWYDINKKKRSGNAHFCISLVIIIKKGTLSRQIEEYLLKMSVSVSKGGLLNRSPHFASFLKELKIPTFILTIYIGMNLIFWLEDWYIQPTRSRHSRWDSCPLTKLSEAHSDLLSDVFLPLFSLSPGEVCHVLTFTSSIAAPGRLGGNRPATLEEKLVRSGGSYHLFYLLVLLRAWSGTRSEDDTSLCCPEEIVWSRPGSQYSPS